MTSGKFYNGIYTCASEDVPDAAVEFSSLLCLQVHRHHLGLRWPEKETYLSARSVVIHVDGTAEEYNISKDLFTSFSRLNGHCFRRIQDIQFDS